MTDVAGLLVIEPTPPGFEVRFEPPPVTAAANADYSDSGMIAWYPSPDEVKQFLLPGGEDADHIHCTILYLGNAADVDADHVRAVVQAVAQRFSPFTARVGGYALFQTDDSRVLVALIDAPELEQLQQRLHDEIVPTIDIPDNHGFTAHVTLKYLEPDDEVDPAWFTRPTFDVEISSISTDIGATRDDYPLTTEVSLGDIDGHQFHGNQWTGGEGGQDVATFIAQHPRLPGEAVFEWQARIVNGLPEQQKSDIVFATREQYPPVKFIADGIQAWNAAHGLPPLPADVNQTKADLQEAHDVARYFETTPDQSGDPKVQAAYEDFKRQNEEMYDYMTKPASEGGLGITIEFTNQKDPYATAEEQAKDLEENHHMSTESGLGGAHEATMTQDEYDRFRAVHDVFGHAGIGGGFDRHGEWQAWLTHASMYTGLGRDAMSTEYHAVNSASWGGEPGSPGTGKSILLPEKWANPPWDRKGLTASAAPTNATIIKALGLDAEWATKFSKMPWHTDSEGNVVAAVQTLDID